ncbi:hypothetical protein BDA96_01G429300 [Sorghum bicolor]|uniref:Uncharacterized protein n=2 Tax=Sorghum bicolor TaxID=4558 RepID=A0A921V0H5_SORBI|nr:hypothetical protein BDA96_01G429300 [Sorghum bicolor]OQU92752.1 hypothetical protein SORBI_3001G403350 [Sorghum bicolor]
MYVHYTFCSTKSIGSPGSRPGGRCCRTVREIQLCLSRWLLASKACVNGNPTGWGGGRHMHALVRPPTSARANESVGALLVPAVAPQSRTVVFADSPSTGSLIICQKKKKKRPFDG